MFLTVDILSFKSDVVSSSISFELLRDELTSALVIVTIPSGGVLDRSGVFYFEECSDCFVLVCYLCKRFRFSSGG